MARCAVCRIDLVNHEKIAFVDEFLVHPRCLGGTPAIKLELATQSTLVDQTRAVVSHTEQRAQRSREMMDRLLDSTKRSLEASEALERSTRVAHQNVQRDLEVARAELVTERSRRMAAELSQQLQQIPQATPEPDPDTQKDDAETRFSLLELA